MPQHSFPSRANAGLGSPFMAELPEVLIAGRVRPARVLGCAAHDPYSIRPRMDTAKEVAP